LGSPPGWYWYLPWVEPVSHGMLFLARGTVLSDVDLVGVRPGKRIRISGMRNAARGVYRSGDSSR
jgi:hypothetical protein